MHTIEYYACTTIVLQLRYVNFLLTPTVYETRLENGYDLYTDSNYVAWLKAYHPESLPSFTTVPSLFADLDTGFQDEELLNNCTGT